MVRLTTFPRGAGEGLVVLPIDPGTDPGVLEREGRWPGVWALQIDPRAAWHSEAGETLLAACVERTLVGVIDLDAVPERWPALGPQYDWCVDATKLVRGGNVIERLGGVDWLPQVQDLWVDLEVDQTPPTAAELSLLAGAVQARCCYLYVPPDYPLRATLVRAVAQAAELWAVRWLTR